MPAEAVGLRSHHTAPPSVAREAHLLTDPACPEGHVLSRCHRSSSLFLKTVPSEVIFRGNIVHITLPHPNSLIRGSSTYQYYNKSPLLRKIHFTACISFLYIYIIAIKIFFYSPRGQKSKTGLTVLASKHQSVSKGVFLLES